MVAFSVQQGETRLEGLFQGTVHQRLLRIRTRGFGNILLYDIGWTASASGSLLRRGRWPAVDGAETDRTDREVRR